MSTGHSAARGRSPSSEDVCWYLRRVLPARVPKSHGWTADRGAFFFGWGLGWLGWPSRFLRHAFAVENWHGLKKRSFTLSSPQCSAKDLATFWPEKHGAYGSGAIHTSPFLQYRSDHPHQGAALLQLGGTWGVLQKSGSNSDACWVVVNIICLVFYPPVVFPQVLPTHTPSWIATKKATRHGGTHRGNRLLRASATHTHSPHSAAQACRV